eukprot:15456021-Alexandrium_andersonii.AAC.1
MMRILEHFDRLLTSDRQTEAAQAGWVNAPSARRVCRRVYGLARGPSASTGQSPIGSRTRRTRPGRRRSTGGGATGHKLGPRPPEN